MAQGTFLKGKDTKVALGTSMIVGVGKWEMSGVTTDFADATCVGDTWKQPIPVLLDGGTISFDGLYDATDSTGQTQLRTYNVSQTLVTSIRFYINATSYWTPATTNPASGCYISDWKIGADKAGLVTMSFTAKVAGAMVIV